jgi:hypothetical protein
MMEPAREELEAAIRLRLSLFLVAVYQNVTATAVSSRRD